MPYSRLSLALAGLGLLLLGLAAASPLVQAAPPRLAPAAPGGTRLPPPAGGQVPLDCDWQAYPIPAPVPEDTLLDGLAALAPNDIWAVGDYTTSFTGSHTLIEHWNGTAWKIVPSPNPGSELNTLVGIRARTPSDIWAVGYFQINGMDHSLTLHWDGQQWTWMPNPDMDTDDFLWDVAILAPADVWAVGLDYRSGYSQTLVEHWDGTAWSVVPSLEGPYLWSYLYGVVALSPTDIWAVGAARPLDAALQQPLLAHWDGTGWTAVPGPAVPGGLLWKAAFTSASDGWAVGETGNALTLIAHWNGQSWTQVASPSPAYGSNPLYSLVILAPDNIWAAGEAAWVGGPNHTLVLHWDGLTWQWIPSANPGAYLSEFRSIAAVAPDNLWAVGDLEQCWGCWFRPLLERYQQACPLPTATATATATPALAPPPPLATDLPVVQTATPLPAPPSVSPAPARSRPGSAP
ncbi:MAG TPA: hypothetical protein VKY74_20210 [Chloroflexia bacterium]|nr:hypothetical protein [Chloroflexia bacterium]